MDEQEKNDWENDDDWDDWGDAEDNFQDALTVPEQQKTNNNESSSKTAPTEKTITNVKDPDSNQNDVATTKPEQQQEVNRSSWASMLRPFGGVVSTITTTVSQGLNQVIGVPDPEELARINTEEEAKLKESNTFEDDTKAEREEKECTTTMSPAFGLGLVSGVTSLGTKVLNTGLDTLEGIGKKTMNILQENDPLLINKRKLLGLEPDRPNLSAVLKQAKEDADQWENTFKKLQIEKAKSALHFEALFENHCGLVHLEALEILSKESTLKLQKLLDAFSGRALRDLQETVNEVKELMELEELEGESEGDYTAEELNERLVNAIEDAEFTISFDDIVNIWSQSLTWLNESNPSDTERTAEELFTRGITTLAETCALEMNKLHKIAELLLVKDHHSTANEVDGIVQLCKQFHIHLNGLTNLFATKLTATKEKEEAKNLTSTLFSEMLQATSHIDKAFKLFLPIIQIGAA